MKLIDRDFQFVSTAMLAVSGCIIADSWNICLGLFIASVGIVCFLALKAIPVGESNL